MSELLVTEIPLAITMLFALMNPFALVGIYLALVKNYSTNERLHLLIIMVIAINVTLFVFLYMGTAILDFFGVDIAGFTTAGGLIILLIGLAMVTSKHETHYTNGIDVTEKSVPQKPTSVAIVPLAIPIFAGPGTISTVIHMSQTFSTTSGNVSISIGIVTVSLVVFVVFFFSPVIFSKIGKTGLNIITRLMGLILMALAFDMLATGIIGLFPILS